MGNKLCKYRCGHVGRSNESPYAKLVTFIRIADVGRETGGSPVVEESVEDCPDCKGGT